MVVVVLVEVCPLQYSNPQVDGRVLVCGTGVRAACAPAFDSGDAGDTGAMVAAGKIGSGPLLQSAQRASEC